MFACYLIRFCSYLKIIFRCLFLIENFINDYAESEYIILSTRTYRTLNNTLILNSQITIANNQVTLNVT